MPPKHDPAMSHSNYERRDNDRYFTEHWCTKALLRVIEPTLKELGGVVFDPAAGRGDILIPVHEAGFKVAGSDIDMSEFRHDDLPTGAARWEKGFNAESVPDDATALLTNPPFGKNAARFLEEALMTPDHIELVVFMMRSEWKSAESHTQYFNTWPDMFGFEYVGEVILTSRPRWDWHLPPEEIAQRKLNSKLKLDGPKYEGPRHNYSWYIFRRLKPGQKPAHPTTWFRNRLESRDGPTGKIITLGG